MATSLSQSEKRDDQPEDFPVAINVIQSVECDESGVAYPHVITRLLEDGIMTLLSMSGSSRAELKTSPVTLDALTIGNHQPCVANQTVAVYCKVQIDPQGQNPHPTFQLRIVCTQSGNLIADSNIQISRGDILDIAVWPPSQASENSMPDIDGKVILMCRFTAQHRGQAGHINIQNFAQSAQDACRHVATLLGVPRTEQITPVSEKIRFRAEMHPGDIAIVRCALQHTEQRHWMVSGEMIRVRDNATVCQFQKTFQLGKEQNSALPIDHPSLLEKLPIDLNDIPVAETIWGPRETYRGTVEPLEVDMHLNLSTRALWDKLTRALWSVQNALGANRDVMIEHKLAGGASMFQLQFHEPIKLGTPVVINSRVHGCGTSSLRMQHEVSDARDNKVLVVANYVLTFFDRTTGKRAPVPTFMLKQLNAA